MVQIDFKGKHYISSHHLSVPYRELLIDKDASHNKDNPSLDDNLIIHGDNLHALKALLPKYAGKVNCIYIDPPYNTGNEGWCYNDKVNSPLMREWIQKEGNPVDKEDMERHDKWLCMMYPRLRLLHELLADDGVIFISIDDNEVHHLRMVMDEIFGEENFVGCITWEKRTKSQNTETAKDQLQSKVEYIFTYKNTPQKLRFNLEIAKEKEYNLKDDKGLYREKTLEEMSALGMRGRETMIYEIQGIFPSKDKQWKVGEREIRLLENRGDLFIKNGNIIIKMRPEDEDNKHYVPFWSHFFDKDSYGTAETGKTELNNIMGSFEHGFETVKPKKLIEKLFFHIKQQNNSCLEKNAIILDSFAGSGTTAHAVLDLNKQDGGNRKFILVEMEDYAHTITAERVRRVIDGVPHAKDDTLKNGLGGTFTFATLGEAFEIDKILTGDKLPSYEQLASYVFYTSTGQSLLADAKPQANFYVGETEQFEIYLIYKADKGFLRSNDSALDDEKLKIIADKPSTKRKIVFATAKYMGQNMLTEKHITFCQLPYHIHKLIEA